MPEEVQNSKKGKSLREGLFHFKNSSVGQQAPDFEVTDVNNQPWALSSFRGKKYVLLDFWASWCIPCRQDYPFLKQAYENYQSKGLEIILISSDKDLMKWRAAIKQDGTDNWKHFSLQENNSFLETSYSVIGIPLKVLIDRDGKIIARWLGGAEEKINDEMRKTFLEIFE
jgi:peroxiredoxin